MSRKTLIRDISTTLYVAFSRGTSVEPAVSVRLVRPKGRAGTKDDEVFYMSEVEARALLQTLIGQYPLDALGSV